MNFTSNNLSLVTFVGRKATFVALLVALVGATVAVLSPINAQAAFMEVGPSPLGDANATTYGIRKPDNWNGLLLIDLDYVLSGTPGG